MNQISLIYNNTFNLALVCRICFYQALTNLTVVTQSEILEYVILRKIKLPKFSIHTSRYDYETCGVLNSCAHI